MLAVPLPVVEESVFPNGARHFVVVYQFGKVASTSLVTALSAIEGVVAVQSHFLGLAAFSDILALVVDPTHPDYFAQQELGQLVRNVSIERTIAAIRARLCPGVTLTMLSLSREPIDWFRSSLAQDIDGYLRPLREVAAVGPTGSDEEAVIRGLPLVAEIIASVLEASNGVDAFLYASHGERETILRRRYGDHDPRVMNEFLFRFLQPYRWFDFHFARYIGLCVPQMNVVAPQVYCADLGCGAGAYVIRYEDIDSSVRVVLNDIGIGSELNLARENASDDKTLARAVQQGMVQAPLDRLYALSSASSYAQQFGYAPTVRI